MNIRSPRIEICGGIASGKTTLCAVLRQAGWTANFENFHQNPFWALFYRNPSLHAFETEVTFLLQHYAQIKTARASNVPIVCDFSLLQDRAYAGTNLTGGPLTAFHAVYHQVLAELSSPALLIHLECGADVELARIRRRARSEERQIKPEYLITINSAVTNGVHAEAEGSRVLAIDSGSNDFANDKVTQTRILELVSAALLE